MLLVRAACRSVIFVNLEVRSAAVPGSRFTVVVQKQNDARLFPQRRLLYHCAIRSESVTRQSAIVGPPESPADYLQSSRLTLPPACRSLGQAA